MWVATGVRRYQAKKGMELVLTGSERDLEVVPLEARSEQALPCSRTAELETA